MCRHTGLVARALGVSLNLRVLPAATPTSMPIYRAAWIRKSDLRSTQVDTLGLHILETQLTFPISG